MYLVIYCSSGRNCTIILFYIILAAIIFTTYFEDLVVLNSDRGYFITDNDSMRKFVTSAIKVSLNGVSLTVISFTIVFLFHGVGGELNLQ